MKRPSLQFYPGDWLRDTGLRSCSVAARGLWIDLICFMHDGSPYGHLGVGRKDTTTGIPEGQLAQMVGLPVPELRALLGELERAGLFDRTPEGVIYSRRMVRDEQLREARAACGGRSLENPNVPRPKAARGRARDVHRGIHDGHPEGGDGVPSPAFAFAVASASTPPTPASRAARETWLTPYWDAWVEVYGGKPAAGPLVKALKSLHDEHGLEQTLTRWRNYLGGTEARFASAARFAATFGTWATTRVPGLPPGVKPDDRVYDDDGQPTAAGRALGL